jgi:hypothetical protein
LWEEGYLKGWDLRENIYMNTNIYHTN